MEEKKTILVDSHVHIYDCFDIKKFFESAVDNFCGIHNQLKLTEKFIGVLFLTEAGDTNYFKKISENKNYFSDTLNIKFESTQEENSVRIKIDPGNYIIIISGQQIITSENLEVLALGTKYRFEYGKNILETIEEIKIKNCVPVVPWGVGKWFGKRGRVVESVLNKQSDFFFGDNSGRPFFWSVPDLLRKGLKRKIYTFRGSDPLPLKSQEKKVGTFGFYFIANFDDEKPWESMKYYFNNLKEKPQNYGKLESLHNFIINQFTLQLKNYS